MCVSSSAATNYFGALHIYVRSFCAVTSISGVGTNFVLGGGEQGVLGGVGLGTLKLGSNKIVGAWICFHTVFKLTYMRGDTGRKTLCLFMGFSHLASCTVAIH